MPNRRPNLREDLRAELGRRLFDSAADFALATARAAAARPGVGQSSDRALYYATWETTYFMVHVVDRLAFTRNVEWRNQLMAVLEPATIGHGIERASNLQAGSIAFEQAAAEHAATLARRHAWYGAMELKDPFDEGDRYWGYARLAAAAFGRSDHDSPLAGHLAATIGLRLRDLRLRQAVGDLHRRYPTAEPT
jgi:hypothetical protein